MSLKKKLISLTLMLLLILCSIPLMTQEASATLYVSGGDLTSTLEWSLSDDGVLSITGTGEIPDFGTYGGTPWYSARYEITSAVISSGVTGIANATFYNCANMTSVTIPNTVTTIGGSAFRNCSSLETVAIPSSVTSIGNYAFHSCTSLDGVTLPNNLTAIGEQVFLDCKSLTNISIPYNVASIGYGAFYGCTALKDVTFKGDAPEIAYNAFYGVTATVYYHDYSDYSWDETNLVDYDGDLTWVAFCGRGSCGENLTWLLTADGLLTISGTGDMTNYTQTNNYYGDIRTPWYLYSGSMKKVVIEPGVTSIGKNAFYNCTGFTEITIPDTVVSINEYAFSGASGLTSVVIPEGITVINEYTFNACTGLKSVTIPDGVTSIGNGAFQSCTGLTSIEIPDSVTTIGWDAFEKCTALTEAKLPAGLTTIPSSMFYGCSALTDVSIPDGVTTIDSFAFYGCSKLTEIVLPDSVTTLSTNVFNSCSKLEHVTLSGNLKNIPDGTFESTSALKTIALPDGITSIGQEAFYYSGLTEITLPASVTGIGASAFGGSSKLKEITFLGDCPSISSNSFSGVVADVYYPTTNATWTADVMQNYGGTLTWPAYESTGACGDSLTWGVTEDGILVIMGTGSMTDYAAGEAPWYAYAQEITGIDFRAGVGSIGSNAFAGFTALAECTIPADITAIGANAFSGCTALESVTFAGGAPAIGTGAFQGVEAAVYYPVAGENWTDGVLDNYGGDLEWYGYVEMGACGDDLTWIFCGDGRLIISGTGTMTSYSKGTSPWYAYGNQITELVLRPGMTSIGSYAFYGCTALTEVTIPEGVTSIGGNAFNSCSVTAIDIPEGVTKIYTSAFSNCKSLKEATIPAGVTAIESSLFSGSTALERVVIPEGVTSIGTYAFSGCTALTSVTLPEGITSIPNYVFRGCTALKDVTLPDSITTIGEEVFINCTALTAIKLPENLNKINYNAFNGCTSLRSVTFPAKLTQVYQNAFTGCTSLTELYVASAGVSIGYQAFKSTGLQRIFFLGDAHAITASPFEKYITAYYPADNTTWTSDKMQNYGANRITWVPMSAHGTCGEETGWVLSADGMLSIFGSGEISDYPTSGAAPWNAYADSITEIEVAETITGVGGYAFSGCRNVENVYFRGAPPVIHELAFQGITTTARYPYSAPWPEEYQQNYGGNLTWTDWKTVLSSGTCGADGDNLTWVITEDRVLTVSGTGAMKDSSYSSIWSIYDEDFDTVVIEPGATTIGNNAFARISNVTDITIPDTVTTIGTSSFTYCHGLTEISLPESVKTIGKSAFSYSNGLTEVTLPEGLEELQSSAFYSCTALTHVTVPGTMTTVGNAIWYGCTALNSVTIEDGVSAITYNMFGNCTALTEITIPSCVTSIAGNAFQKCAALNSITFEGDAPAITDTAFTSVEATAYYPCGNETWNADVMQAYGGTIAWETDHAEGEAVEENPVAGSCTVGSSHDSVVYCTVCGIEVSRETVTAAAPGHTEEAVPGYDATCVASGLTDGSKCSVCGEILAAQEEIPVVEHTPGDAVTENETAATCIAEGSCDTVVYCTECGGELSRVTNAIPATGEHTYVDGVCTGCGEAEEITYDMSVAGANMSLGSELAVNFFVKKVDIDTSKDYYIQVTKTYADGRADVTKTYYFQKGEWMDYNSTYYGVKFNGVAAKEMADKLYVQVFHADGTPASDVWTDSIRDYAMRMFGKGTNEKKTMYVDMLNYGAAAQTEFGYGTDDLANSKLTAEHQAYATQTIAYANNRVEGENYYGTNLNLGSSIALNMYFQNVSQDMYAIATYTDHYGNEKEVRIEGSAFVLNKASTNGYRISINTLAVADVRQLVTCTVYNTDGTVVGTCTDSVEGYIARKANSSALYDAIMRFATSAYNSFH